MAPLILTGRFLLRHYHTTCNISFSLRHHANMHIQTIPILGEHKNYAYLLIDEKTKETAIVDPSDPKALIPIIKQLTLAGDIKLTRIITTHHHWDHAGGNKDMAQEFPGITVTGGKDCDGTTHFVKNDEDFKVGNIKVKALHTPCHTQDSVCYYAVDGSQKSVFTGDTLFIAGCGRFFEGTAAEMYKALQILADLPDDTKVYPGHEYTESNARFAKSVDDSEAVNKLVEFCETTKETPGRFTIADEKTFNPFMRVTDPVFQEATGQQHPVQVMEKLREMKNNS
ncbi:putative hydroxyacylglutathione hydrolase [Neolecta irregularis DAH-3]|uniref:hydroxyacylglutathione hydrolase n=1 Tax=Neolecta irregularis (strain DAH-3) TaxID=1198029 RepID=A0A1U7LP40_NEOID|nr:putative hydroxyacylglutathione hydrolase [Neolecta irregularis DAH-3]|eukprot:OLL24312.1 putative hydroxyacylglutathione hydrolase [Neolecta irregularis DAH-3]